MKRGKKYIEAAKKVDAESLYTYDDAVKLVKEIAFEKFDATIGISVKLNIKKSHSIRDTLVLPNQFSGEKKVLVFAKGEKAEEAKKAGAAFVGDDDLIQKIKDGWLDFDVAVATPDMMKDVGRLGPILGRRGLMPNPKTQTVTMDVTGAIAQLQQGRVEFRADKTGVVNLAIGKVSMEPAKVLENVKIFVKELERKRPQDLKGEFISSVALSSTMGPGVKIQFKEAGK